MKKSFTLVEIMISISLFMIVVLFLSKALDQSKHSNEMFEKKSIESLKVNDNLKIFFEDITESTSKVEILKDDNKNSIVRFKSSNLFHNPHFNNITYLISKSNKLLRIESKSKFNLSDASFDFYDYAYIDILFDDIEYFEVIASSKNQNLVFAIKEKEKKRVLFNTFQIMNVDTK